MGLVSTTTCVTVVMISAFVTLGWESSVSLSLVESMSGGEFVSETTVVDEAEVDAVRVCVSISVSVWLSACVSTCVSDSISGDRAAEASRADTGAGLGRKYVEMGAWPVCAMWNGMRLGVHFGIVEDLGGCESDYCRHIYKISIYKRLCSVRGWWEKEARKNMM